MIKKANLLFLGLLLIHFAGKAQQGVIKGRVLDAKNNESLPFVNVSILDTTKGTSTDDKGSFEIGNLKPGYYNIQATYIGYETNTIYEIQVFNSKPTIVNFAMIELAQTLDEIVIKPKLFSRPKETPMSIKSLGVTEIMRSPGGGRDISRVVQTLPGVASSPASNRNDMIIRGGGPSENKFYVDGFEVNAINHFTTQGASGGVWGIIDANQLKQLNLISGAFPAYANNALSSVFDIELKEGNIDKFDMQLNLGILQRGLNANGHIGKNTTFLTGIRQANFDLIFPNRTIIPSFTDVIAKTVTKINDKNKIELFGLMAFDDLNFNTDVEKTDEHLYSLERVRRIKQNTYTLGVKWMKYWDNGSTNIILSRNSLTNDITKHKDNDETQLKLLDYYAEETTNTLAIRNKLYFKDYKLGFGASYKYKAQTVDNLSYRVNANGIQPIDFETELNFQKMGLYINGSKSYLDNALDVSIGVRTDFSNYSDQFSNPLEQISPRISLSYALSDKLSLNANTGIYYQDPSFTSLAFIENDVLINKENEIKPIQSTHYIAGLEYNTAINSSITLEGFYKQYANYPFSVNDQISLANKGAGFGVYGAESLTSTSKGRSYGLEIMYQQKLYKGFYGMLSYTYIKSEFTNDDDNYIASSWDYGHILSATIGKRFKRNWEVGAKWVFYGGTPYTPYDENASANIQNWDTRNKGILDYSKLNTLRTNNYHQLDIRVDKKFYFRKWNLNLFADIQNVYDYIGGVPPNLILDRDANFETQLDPNNPNSYVTKYAKPEGFGLRPNIGIIVEF